MQEYEDQSQNVRENADPGREYAAPGLEIQQEQPRHYTPTPADQRQNRKNAQREKMLRTLLLSTAVVATAAAATGQLKPKTTWQVAHHDAITDIYHEWVGDKCRLYFTTDDSYDPEQRPYIAPSNRDENDQEHHIAMTPYDADPYGMAESHLEDHLNGDGYLSEERIKQIENAQLDVICFYIEDKEPGVSLKGTDNEDGTRSYYYEIDQYDAGDPDMLEVTDDTVAVIEVKYPEGESYYADKYYYQFGNGSVRVEPHVYCVPGEGLNWW